jgi:hypothetical protein
MRFVLAGALLALLAASTAEPKSPKAQCKDRCSVNYSACLKRALTAKGREGCRLERKSCKGSCNTKLPKHS